MGALGSLVRPHSVRPPAGWNLCGDLAYFGIGWIPAMHGHFQRPSGWISDTACAVLGAEFGQLRRTARGGYGAGWTGQYSDRHLFNNIETWLLANGHGVATMGRGFRCPLDTWTMFARIAPQHEYREVVGPRRIPVPPLPGGYSDELPSEESCAAAEAGAPSMRVKAPPPGFPRQG
eukprot:2749994-Amphidinium_carterae.1